LSVVVFQPVEHVAELAHEISVAPFATIVILVMLPEDTLAFADSSALFPLILAPGPGEVKLTVGIGGFDGPFFHF
jgi:hypothetical protein